MTHEEYLERVKPVIEALLDGQIHAELETLLNDVKTDYEKGMDGGAGEWETKYKELKERYVKRFLEGKEEVTEKKEEEVKKDEGGDLKEEKSEEEIEVKDIFEEDKK